MTTRCEPPPELRGVDGWHWLGAHCPVFWIAEEQEWDWTEDEHVAPDVAYRYGYRYLSPVATPAEVEALRADAAEWQRLCFIAEPEMAAMRAEVESLRAERDTMEKQMLSEHQAAVDQFGIAEVLRARVAELEGAIIRAKEQYEGYGLIDVVPLFAAISPTPDRAQGGQ